MINPEMQNSGCKMQNQDRHAVCLVRDLLFYSKIRSAAAAAGVELKSVRDPARLADETGTGLLVDLNQDGALQAAIAWREQTARPVVGFVSHVDGETIKTARAAGIDRVLARSQFEQNLPGILRELSQS
jgi:hypothetical protein